MFNTEYNGAHEQRRRARCGRRSSRSRRSVNVWVGRFLPPSDRANLYGPYYANHWAVYTDGVQDGYPFVFQGRDNGAMYWGQFGKVKVSGGAFDGAIATGDDTLIGAGRVQVDLWDPEPGYYLNGTYYGDKNILAIGGAGQVQGDDRTAYSVDFLLERKVGAGGAFTVEAEWAKYDGLGRLQPAIRHQRRRLRAGQLPVSGARRARAGSRSSASTPTRASAKGPGCMDVDYDQDTTELNLNYVHAPVQLAGDAVLQGHALQRRATGFKQIGVGLQVQM